jgi:hypothetical protein
LAAVSAVSAVTLASRARVPIPAPGWERSRWREQASKIFKDILMAKKPRVSARFAELELACTSLNVISRPRMR